MKLRLATPSIRFESAFLSSLSTAHNLFQLKNSDLQTQMAKLKKQLEGYELAMQEMTEKLVQLQLQAAGMQ